jgi:hypothetical protein
MVTTLVAGASLGILAISTFGSLPTLFLFLGIAVLGSAAERAISRQR